MPEHERRQKTAAALQRASWSPSALIDHGFFVFAGIASFWLAWLVWREGWASGGWWLICLFAAAWAITAYLALPRLHRILSSLYVPNYFIGRTRTGSGLLGDPVNIAFRGSEAELHRAMQSAGWSLADEITARSAWRMVAATVLRRSYPSAPVSPLFLFGRRQDFSYQQEIDGSPERRHHVRFWRCPSGWLLPGGHKVDWLAAGTYDKSVGLSLFTLQLTHKIDENTDIERDYIVQEVTKALPSIKVTNLRDFSTGYHARNGGGDTIQTDGNLPVVELGGTCSAEHDPRSLILDKTKYEQRPAAHDTLLQALWSRQPPQISFAVVLATVTAGMLVLGAVVDMIYVEQYRQEVMRDFIGGGMTEAAAMTAAHWTIAASVAITIGSACLIVWLAQRTSRGSDRARQLLMTAASAAAMVASISLTVGKLTWLTAGLLVFIGLNIINIVLLSADASQRFTQAHRKL